MSEILLKKIKLLGFVPVQRAIVASLATLSKSRGIRYSICEKDDIFESDVLLIDVHDDLVVENWSQLQEIVGDLPVVAVGEDSISGATTWVKRSLLASTLLDTLDSVVHPAVDVDVEPDVQPLAPSTPPAVTAPAINPAIAPVVTPPASQPTAQTNSAGPSEAFKTAASAATGSRGDRTPTADPLDANSSPFASAIEPAADDLLVADAYGKQTIDVDDVITADIAADKTSDPIAPDPVADAGIVDRHVDAQINHAEPTPNLDASAQGTQARDVIAFQKNAEQQSEKAPDAFKNKLQDEQRATSGATNSNLAAGQAPTAAKDTPTAPQVSTAPKPGAAAPDTVNDTVNKEAGKSTAPRGPQKMSKKNFESTWDRLDTELLAVSKEIRQSLNTGGKRDPSVVVIDNAPPPDLPKEPRSTPGTEPTQPAAETQQGDVITKTDAAPHKARKAPLTLEPDEDKKEQQAKSGIDGDAANVPQNLGEYPKKIVSREEAKHTDRFLVVDDSSYVWTQLEICLKNWKVDVDFVSTAEDGLEELRKRKYSLVFLDVMLPYMNGYDACKKIKKDKNNRRVPVVMLTGKSSPANKLKGVLSGCNYYLTKPVAEAEVHAVVDRFYIKLLKISA